ncbi:MAG TPA: hypothetical protein VL738_00170 [Dactylosporangium sp.]|nr:hypothetical protein [Dactylosporangium sp.]
MARRLARRADQLLSHAGLLQAAAAPAREAPGLDAIVVPTARRIRGDAEQAAALLGTARLAESLGTRLVALASRDAGREDIAELVAAHGVAVDLVAIDAPRVPGGGHPYLETAEMLAGTDFERDVDVSQKRNLALLLARSVGWRRIAFLDDDITVPDPADLRRAAGALNGHAVVGLRVGGFEDNSVVCHARRALGDPQDTFVGGGAMVVSLARAAEAFFPDVYNEDWFFLLGEARLRGVARFGAVRQRPFDPFEDTRRALDQEFGDTLAEGVFAVLGRGGTIRDTLNEGYWMGFLATRRRLIQQLLVRATTTRHEPGRDRMITALQAARARSYLIEPRACLRFLLAWRRDRLIWSEAVTALPTTLRLEEALDEFGLGPATTVHLGRRARRPLFRR